MRYSSSLFEPVYVFFNKHKMTKYVLLLVFLFLVFGATIIFGLKLSNVAEKEENTVISSETYDNKASEFEHLKISKVDLDEDISQAKNINLNDYSDEIIIDEGGVYSISGDFTGHIVIDAADENVRLVLSGANIVSKFGPAIICSEANKLIIMGEKDTDNYISDSGDYDVNSKDDACITSKSSITINGNINISGFYDNAIHSSDVIRIVGGVVNIKSKGIGINAKDGVVISGGDVNIETEKTGIKSSSVGAKGRGNVVISGGNVSIIAKDNGIKASKAGIYIYESRLYVNSVLKELDAPGTIYVQEGCME